MYAAGMGERFDLLDEDGNKTGATKDRKLVHQDGAFALCSKPALTC